MLCRTQIFRVSSEYERTKNDIFELRACTNAHFSERERASIEWFDLRHNIIFHYVNSKNYLFIFCSFKNKMNSWSGHLWPKLHFCQEKSFQSFGKVWLGDRHREALPDPVFDRFCGFWLTFMCNQSLLGTLLENGRKGPVLLIYRYGCKCHFINQITFIELQILLYRCRLCVIQIGKFPIGNPFANVDILYLRIE